MTVRKSAFHDTIQSVSTRVVILAVVFVSFFSCSYTFASIRPSFYLETCAWNATDIEVVAPMGDLTHFKVVEAIKGDLKPGDDLELPGLVSFKGGTKKLAELVAIDLTDVFDFDRMFQDPPPTHPGDRLIVFLRRRGTPLDSTDQSGPPAEADAWQPASKWDGLLTSTVWIQDGKVYAYLQTMNPGPTHLDDYLESEEQVRSQISAVLKLRAELDRASAIADQAERIRQLVALMHSGDAPGGAFARAAALRKLAEGGDPETIALLALLSDDSLLGWHQDIIQALAGKPTANSQFGRFLREETKYWSTACKTLKPGWWNHMNGPKIEQYRGHYTRAQSLLRAIGAQKSLEVIPEVWEFASIWSGCPSAGSAGEKNHIAEELKLLLASPRR